VWVKTYGDIITEYEFHPESKCADSSGNICQKPTTGLLYRRHIKIGQVKCIGKESNSLEDVDAGLMHSEASAYTEYIDPNRDEWKTTIQPSLRKIRLKDLVKACEGIIHRRELIELRAGRSTPHRRNLAALRTILQKLGFCSPGS
jgi:hypothetical protein